MEFNENVKHSVMHRILSGVCIFFYVFPLPKKKHSSFSQSFPTLHMTSGVHNESGSFYLNILYLFTDFFIAWSNNLCESKKKVVWRASCSFLSFVLSVVCILLLLLFSILVHFILSTTTILQTICPRKPLFLPRNIRIFNLKNKGIVSPLDGTTTIVIGDNNLSSANINNNNNNSTTSTTPSSTNTTTGTVTTTTTTSSSSVINKEETVLVTTTSLPGGGGGGTTATALITANASTVTNSLEKRISMDDMMWKKGPPERIGSDTTNSMYVVDDNVEVKLEMKNYKMVYVMNKDGIFYKRNSIYRARLVSLIFFIHFFFDICMKLEKGPWKLIFLGVF